MADDFCSSDLVLPDEESAMPRKVPRSMAMVVEMSEVDRIKSKQAVKNLRDTKGAPSSVAQREYMHTLFKGFQEHTLKKPAGSQPDGEQIARFIDRLPSYLAGKCPGGVPSWRTLKRFLYSLQTALVFHNNGFRLSETDAARIDTIIDNHVKNKVITKHPVREHLWVTSQIVRRMALAMLKQALESGARCWDVVISRVLGIVLQAALCCRSGDFRTSEPWIQIGDKHLIWKHITIKATGEDVDNPALVMLVQLYYRKGYKNDPTAVMSIELRQLPDEFNVVDPIKLLLVHALRVSAVAETSWQELVQNLVARPNKTVVWSTPESPVFYAFKPKAIGLNTAKAATARQQLDTMQMAADMVGLLQKPWTHDLRRGAAGDLTYKMKTALPGASLDTVRSSLGHTHSALSHGITEKYQGRKQGDSWGARILGGQEAADGKENDDPFGLQLALKPWEKPAPLNRLDIDAKCISMDLDGKKKTDREKAGRAIHKEERESWVAHQNQLLNTPTPIGGDDSFGEWASSKPRKKRSIEIYTDAGEYDTTFGDLSPTGIIDAGRKRQRVRDSPDLTEQETAFSTPYNLTVDGDDVGGDALATAASPKSYSLDFRPQPQPYYMPNSEALPTDSETGLDDVQATSSSIPDNMVESAIHNLSQSLGFIQQDGVHELNETLVDHAIDAIVGEEDIVAQDVAFLTGSIGEFIDRLSRINTVAWEYAKANNGLPPGVDRGGSRDEPSRFLYTCTGCKRSFQTDRQRRSHEALCKATGSTDDATSPTAAPSPSTTSKRPKQKTPAQKYTPQQCPKIDECGETKVFDTWGSFKKHRNVAHGGWAPRQCDVEACRSKTEFQDRNGYYNHLSNIHHLSSAEIKAKLEAPPAARQ